MPKSDYPSIVGELIGADRNAALGPGTPIEAVRKDVVALSVDRIFERHKIVSMPLVNSPIPGIGLDVRLPGHQILNIVLQDQSTVRVKVTGDHAETVQELVYRYLEAKHYREHGKGVPE